MENFAHPSDSKRISYKLPLGAALFLILILIGFATMPDPKHEYTLTSEEMLEKVISREHILTAAQADSLLKRMPDQYKLIDLRNPHEFIKGHFAEAINIPAHHLLDDSYTDYLNQPGVFFILYSDAHSNACPSWMLLQQIGYENIYMLIGGYHSGSESSNLLSSATRDEIARYDFKGLMEELKGTDNAGEIDKTPEHTSKVPLPAGKKKKSVAGGC
jgi:rhodanese-related sulfurtransferase